jgi:hypothetical protein
MEGRTGWDGLGCVGIDGMGMEQAGEGEGEGEGFIGYFRDDLGLGLRSLKGWGSRCGVVVL